jgi:hypothetical protein
MKTREEILESQKYYNKTWVSPNTALSAMDLYAKEIAIAFANYRDDYKREENRKFHAVSERLGGMPAFQGKTDEELFNQFIQKLESK